VYSLTVLLRRKDYGTVKICRRQQQRHFLRPGNIVKNPELLLGVPKENIDNVYKVILRIITKDVPITNVQVLRSIKFRFEKNLKGR
jgi:hypothetical protein